MDPTERGRPSEAAPVTTTTSTSITRRVDSWADTYASARQWVAWTARRRWPDHPANDDIWALSVASWWHGPGSGGRDG